MEPAQITVLFLRNIESNGETISAIILVFTDGLYTGMEAVKRIASIH